GDGALTRGNDDATMHIGDDVMVRIGDDATMHIGDDATMHIGDGVPTHGSTCRQRKEKEVWMPARQFHEKLFAGKLQFPAKNDIAQMSAYERNALAKLAPVLRNCNYPATDSASDPYAFIQAHYELAKLFESEGWRTFQPLPMRTSPPN
ncbi:hypothetical protein IWW54_005806, partial [Coemansia sp. RSA 2705]